MHRTQAAVLAILAFALPASAEFSGERALEWTRKLVALGPRPSGSAAHQKMQGMIVAHLQSSGCKVEEDKFTAQTPLGARAMNNIIAVTPGSAAKFLAISGHYDTKVMSGVKFVGANDGGSSAGFLLELASTVCRRPSVGNQLRLVFFDGEEAVVNWTETDSLYGSRRLAHQWRKNGTLARMTALINVDMIADRELNILNDASSTEWLKRTVWASARELGHGRHFEEELSGVTDDHLPFLQLGAAALDLIDLHYGPQNSFWHTDKDTMDKLSAKSFQVVGDVLLHSIRKIESAK